MAEVKMKVAPKKTTVREELEAWNAVYVIRRLNRYYLNRLSSSRQKAFQGLQAHDFSMNVIEKILKGNRSWESSNAKDFMQFVYGVAKSELSTWRDNKHKDIYGIEDFLKQENKSNLHIRDEYEGF